MSSANERKARFIAKKLDFLKEEKTNLNSAVDKYVNKIIAEGKTWTQAGENKVEFAELCLRIDRAVEFICVKCEEVTGADGDKNVYQQIHVSADLIPQICQTSVPTTKTSHREATATTAATDAGVLHQVLARVCAMEETLRSVQKYSDKIAEKQLENDRLIDEISEQVAKPDKIQNIRLKEVKEQMTNIRDDQTEARKEQKIRFLKMEKKLERLSEKYNELRDQTESCTQQIEERLADVTCRVEHERARAEEIHFTVETFISDCSGKVKGVERLSLDLSERVKANTETIETLSDQFNVITETIETLSDKLNANTETIETLSDKFNANAETIETLSDKFNANTETIETLSDKFNATTETIETLSDKVNANSETLDTLSEKVIARTEAHRTLLKKVIANKDTLETLVESQEQNKSSLREFEIKLFGIEAVSEDELRKLQEKAEKTKNNVGEMEKMIGNLTPRLEQIETKLSRRNVRLTATPDITKQLDASSIFPPYDDDDDDEDVHTKLGLEFNRFTGQLGSYRRNGFQYTRANWAM